MAGFREWLRARYGTLAALNDAWGNAFWSGDFSDWEQSVVSFVRKGAGGEMVFAVCNFTPVPRFGYRISVPEGGWWRELLNSDAAEYGGGGVGNFGRGSGCCNKEQPALRRYSDGQSRR